MANEVFSAETPEGVALRLLNLITAADRNPPAGVSEREWLLDAYAECLVAAKGGRNKPGIRISPINL